MASDINIQTCAGTTKLTACSSFSITSFGDRPNEYSTVSHYFRAHFTQVFKRNNADSKRELYCHLTSVIVSVAFPCSSACECKGFHAMCMPSHSGSAVAAISSRSIANDNPLMLVHRTLKQLSPSYSPSETLSSAAT